MELTVNIRIYSKNNLFIYSFFCYTGDQNFIKQLVNFDKENMSDRVLKKIGQQYVANPEFQVISFSLQMKFGHLDLNCNLAYK